MTQVAVRLVTAFVPDQFLNQVSRHAQLERAGDEPDPHSMPLATTLDAATFHVPIKTLLRRVIDEDHLACDDLPPRSQRRHDARGYWECVSSSTLIFCNL